MEKSKYFSKNARLLRTSLLLVLSFLCAAFIFWNASRTGEESRDISNKVTNSVKDSVENGGMIPPTLAGTSAIKGDTSGDTDGEKISVNVYYLSIYIRKSGHLIEYTAFLFFVSLSLVSMGMKKDFSALLALLIGFLVASADEFIQSNTQGRNGSFTDVLIDMCGCIMGIFFAFCVVLTVYYCFLRLKTRKTKNT